MRPKDRLTNETYTPSWAKNGIVAWGFLEEEGDSQEDKGVRY